MLQAKKKLWIRKRMVLRESLAMRLENSYTIETGVMGAARGEARRRRKGGGWRALRLGKAPSEKPQLVEQGMELIRQKRFGGLPATVAR